MKVVCAWWIMKKTDIHGTAGLVRMPSAAAFQP
jgi:hypothetical protein